MYDFHVRKGQNQGVQPSQGTERRRYEEQAMATGHLR